MLRNARYVYGPETPTVPAHLHYGREMLTRIMQYGDQPALINAGTGETMTFVELAQKTVDIALSLTRLGVRKGDIVSICSERREEIIPTVLGIICAGAVYAPIRDTYGVDLVLHRLKIAKPKIVFMSSNSFNVHKKTFESVGCVETYIVYGEDDKDGAILFKHFVTETACVEDFEPTPVDGWKDLALILFSSGTTGLPKGIPCTHLSYLISCDSCAKDSFKSSSILITQEWYTPYGLRTTLSCIYGGTTCVYAIVPEEQHLLQAIEKYKVKILQSIPNLVNQLIKSTNLDLYDVTSLEAILSTSTPLMKEQIHDVKNRFPNLRDVCQQYAMTEAGCICYDMFSTPKDGSVGQAAKGLVIKVVDIKTREPLGPNRQGEICFKSHTLMTGFYGVDNSDHLDSEGFFKTGDVGYYDDDKYFYVVNRIKELIKYNDKSIAPAEYEAILLKDSRVREAGLTAVTDGGAVAALVALQPHARATPEDLLDYLHSSARHYIRLEGGVHFVKSLPRGLGDKLDRRALHALLLKQMDMKTQIHDEKQG